MLLPIVTRELRVSARNRTTHRLRLLFAVAAVAIGGTIGLLIMASGRLGGSSSSSQSGVWIFTALKWIAFIFACASGVFLTADCLSEEKREGTIGLLFLTDLRGHDVVLGKLLATSLRSFYSLLAIFPVMALSFVLGGVAADEFQLTLLSLCNTLFFSLALGMLVSVVSRQPHKAMSGALAAMIFFLLAMPGLDSLLPVRYGRLPLLGLLSPAYAFTHANTYHAPDYWSSLLLVHLAGWCFLGVASWLAPKTWNEKGLRAGLGAGWRVLLPGPAQTRSETRRLLDKNPVCWIISRDRWSASLARMAMLLLLGLFALSLISLWQKAVPVASAPATVSTVTRGTTNGTTGTVTTTYSISATAVSNNNLFMFASGCSSAMALVLEFWLTAHVCRFYLEGRKSGFLELLWVTPVTRAEFVTGHWLALRRLFLPPVAAQLFLTLACGAIQAWASYSSLAKAPGGGAGATPGFEIWQQTLTVLLGAAGWLLGLITLVWYSIWMGITAKKIPAAMLKTFWYAKILPWFGISFCSGFLFLIPTMLGIVGNSIWLYPLMLQLLFIGVNLALISLARRRAIVALSQWTATMTA